MAPRDLALPHPSPRGKKNSRGAPRLRQIKRSNSSLTLVRHTVIKRVPTVRSQPGREKADKAQLANATVGPDNGEDAILRERERRVVSSPLKPGLQRTTSMAPTVRLPTRRMRKRPYSRSPGPGAASSEVTLRLLR